MTTFNNRAREILDRVYNVDKIAASEVNMDYMRVVNAEKRADEIVAEALVALNKAMEEETIKAFDDGYEAGRSETPPKLVDAIEFMRKQYGWNKSKMAAMLDMTKPNYSDFIHGVRGLPINSIRKAYAIGIPPKVLLQDELDRKRLKPTETQNE